MDKTIIDWLLEDKNPAVAYRTSTEILHQSVDITTSKEWVLKKLPADWQNTKGLWYVYYLTAVAECGLTKDDISEECYTRALDDMKNHFEFGCADFMALRALVMLGLHEHDAVKKVIQEYTEHSLPDGGFLCNRRVNKLNYVPKSCYKADVYALMFLSELKKKGVDVSVGQPLIDYFFRRNIFYRSDDKSKFILDCAVETFHPFEPMQIGVHSIVESFAALGYGNDERLKHAWDFLYRYQNEKGRLILNQTLTKSYLPKETAGKESKWVTFYTKLAEQWK